MVLVRVHSKRGCQSATIATRVSPSYPGDGARGGLRWGTPRRSLDALPGPAGNPRAARPSPAPPRVCWDPNRGPASTSDVRPCPDANPGVSGDAARRSDPDSHWPLLLASSDHTVPVPDPSDRVTCVVRHRSRGWRGAHGWVHMAGGYVDIVVASQLHGSRVARSIIGMSHVSLVPHLSAGDVFGGAGLAKDGHRSGAHELDGSQGLAVPINDGEDDEIGRDGLRAGGMPRQQ